LDTLIRSIVLPVLQGRDWKTAIVVENPAKFGASRQYQFFAERYSRDAIFYDLEKARNWLLGLPATSLLYFLSLSLSARWRGGEGWGEVGGASAAYCCTSTSAQIFPVAAR
jgi:hypothetical protein